MPHRVTLQHQNGPHGVWTPVGMFWAGIRPASGTEKTIANQTGAIITHAVKTRWLGSSYVAGPSMRFQFGTRFLNTVSVLNVDELNHTLIWYCLERSTS